MTQFELSKDYIRKSKVRDNYISIFTIKNVWWIMHQMNYGEEIYPEDQFVPFMRIDHKDEWIPNTDPNMFHSTPSCVYIFEKAGRKYKFVFPNFNEMKCFVYQTDYDTKEKEPPQYFEYKPTRTIRKYDSI